MKLRGVNLGNWLVLEKWMGASPLSVATCEDERGLIDEMPSGELELALEMHRRSYITEKDSAWLARVGVNLVRIPVPYFIWGPRTTCRASNTWTTRLRGRSARGSRCSSTCTRCPSHRTALTTVAT